MGFHYENDFNGEEICLIKEFGEINELPVKSNLEIEIDQGNNATLIEEYKKNEKKEMKKSKNIRNILKMKQKSKLI